MNEIRIHSTALNEGAYIGKGTQVWAFVHLQKDCYIGENCNLGDGVFIEQNAKIGNNVTIKNQCMIWEGVHIADDVFVGPGVTFTNDRFPRSPRMPGKKLWYEKKENWLSPTFVEQGASIGASAVILCGITIGSFAMVAAGSVVTQDVPPFRLVAGNPAKPIAWVSKNGFILREQQGTWIEDQTGDLYEFDKQQQPQPKT